MKKKRGNGALGFRPKALLFAALVVASLITLTTIVMTSPSFRVFEEDWLIRREKPTAFSASQCMNLPRLPPDQHRLLYNETTKLESMICAILTAPKRKREPSSIQLPTLQQGDPPEVKPKSVPPGSFEAVVNRSHLLNDTDPLVFLESGTDPAGKSGCSIATTYPNDFFIGVNCESIGFPSAVACRAPNAWFIGIDCSSSALPLPSEFVDFVLGIYIVEHISNENYFAELHRVLHDGGEGFMEWGPPWASPKGHHLFPSMARDWAKGLGTTTTYANDGTAVPDWGHLYLSKEEMREIMLQHRDQFPGKKGLRLVERMLEYTYDSGKLGRIPLTIMREMAGKYFMIVNEGIATWPLPEPEIRSQLAQWSDSDLTIRWVRWHLRKKQLSPRDLTRYQTNI